MESLKLEPWKPHGFIIRYVNAKLAWVPIVHKLHKLCYCACRIPEPLYMLSLHSISLQRRVREWLAIMPGGSHCLLASVSRSEKGSTFASSCQVGGMGLTAQKRLSQLAAISIGGSSAASGTENWVGAPCSRCHGMSQYRVWPAGRGGGGVNHHFGWL